MRRILFASLVLGIGGCGGRLLINEDQIFGPGDRDVDGSHSGGDNFTGDAAGDPSGGDSTPGDSSGGDNIFGGDGFGGGDDDCCRAGNCCDDTHECILATCQPLCANDRCGENQRCCP